MAEERGEINAYQKARNFQTTLLHEENPFLAPLAGFAGGLTAGFLDPIGAYGGWIVGKGIIGGLSRIAPLRNLLNVNKSTGYIAKALFGKTKDLTRFQRHIRNAAVTGLGVTALDVPALYGYRTMYGRNVTQAEVTSMIVGSALLGGLFPYPASRVLKKYGDEAPKVAKQMAEYKKQLDGMGKSFEPTYFDDAMDEVLYNLKRGELTHSLAYGRISQQEWDKGKFWFGSLRDGEDFMRTESHTFIPSLEFSNNPTPKINSVLDIDNKSTGMLYTIEITDPSKIISHNELVNLMKKKGYSLQQLGKMGREEFDGLMYLTARDNGFLGVYSQVPSPSGKPRNILRIFFDSSELNYSKYLKSLGFLNIKRFDAIKAAAGDNEKVQAVFNDAAKKESARLASAKSEVGQEEIPANRVSDSEKYGKKAKAENILFDETPEAERRYTEKTMATEAGTERKFIMEKKLDGQIKSMNDLIESTYRDFEGDAPEGMKKLYDMSKDEKTWFDFRDNLTDCLLK